MKQQLKQFIEQFVISKTGRFNSNASKIEFWESRSSGIFYFLKSISQEDIPISQMVWNFMNGVEEQPKCQCGTPLTFEMFKTGYRKYCSSRCANLDPIVRKKIEETNIERYGTVSALVDIEKRTAGMNAKYGVDHPMQLQSMRDKIKDTKKVKYGDENYINIDAMKKTSLARYGNEDYRNVDKQVNTNIERYGAKSVLALTEYRIGGMQQKYGVENASQLDFVQDLKKQNAIQKYGVLLQQKHLTPEQVELFNDLEFISNNSTVEIEEKTGYSQSHVSKQLIKFGLLDGFRSYGEREINQFVIANYSGTVKSNDRTALGGLEIDCYLPELNFGIEFNGTYYHSSNRQKHYIKFQTAMDRNIALFQIPEFHWRDSNKRSIWESMILNKLGKTNRVFARKCKLIELDSKTCNVFLNENHLQGACRSSYRIGLVHDDVLVMVMTFGVSRFNVNENELIRLCTKKNTTVIGGASRLFKYARERFNDLITFSDNQFSIGSIYKTLGFTKQTTTIGYCYVKGNEVLSRQKCQKHKLEALLPIFDPQLSETENMILNGYTKYFDAGMTKWKM